MSDYTLNDTNAAVGQILYTSWGYDQTNYDFYEVVERRGKSTLVLRKLKAHHEYTEAMHSTVTPRKGEYDEREEPLVRRIGKNGYARVESYACLWPWDGKPKQATHYA